MTSRRSRTVYPCCRWRKGRCREGSSRPGNGRI